jgi:hypothetical protein
MRFSYRAVVLTRSPPAAQNGGGGGARPDFTGTWDSTAVQARRRARLGDVAALVLRLARFASSER